MNKEVRYLYAVHPKRPIKNLGDISLIRTPKSLQLTLEEVKICLKSGSVYRRFANQNVSHKVTLLNAERLHNAKYMTEEEYGKLVSARLAGERGTVVVEEPIEKEVIDDTVKEESVVETPVEEIVEEVIDEKEPEEVISEESNEVVEEVIDDEETIDSTDVEKTEEKVEETVEQESEDVDDEEEITPSIIEEKKPQNYNNYNNHKKHKK